MCSGDGWVAPSLSGPWRDNERPSLPHQGTQWDERYEYARDDGAARYGLFHPQSVGHFAGGTSPQKAADMVIGVTQICYLTWRWLGGGTWRELASIEAEPSGEYRPRSRSLLVSTITRIPSLVSASFNGLKSHCWFSSRTPRARTIFLDQETVGDVAQWRGYRNRKPLAHGISGNCARITDQSESRKSINSRPLLRRTFAWLWGCNNWVVKSSFWRVRTIWISRKI